MGLDVEGGGRVEVVNAEKGFEEEGFEGKKVEEKEEEEEGTGGLVGAGGLLVAWPVKVKGFEVEANENREGAKAISFFLELN